MLYVSGIDLFDSKKHRLWPLSGGVTDPSMYPIPGHRATAGYSESDHEPSVLQRVRDKYVAVALTVAFLLYSTISTLVFQVRGHAAMQSCNHAVMQPCSRASLYLQHRECFRSCREYSADGSWTRSLEFNMTPLKPSSCVICTPATCLCLFVCLFLYFLMTRRFRGLRNVQHDSGFKY